MLERYRSVVTALPREDVAVAAESLQLLASSATALYEGLRNRGLGQADLVLALLRAGRHAAVERLIGKPITVYPPQPSPTRNLPLPAAAAHARRRIHVRVTECPLVIPSARARWALMRRCASAEQYVTRVERWRALRDLREWQRAGWITVEGEAA